MATVFIRSTTGRAYRRAGIVFTPQWREFDLASLAADHRALIEADSHLRIRRERPASLPLPATPSAKADVSGVKDEAGSKPKAADKGGK